jgi:hypothetical protein
MARPDVKFSAAVAGFGMLLRNSANAGTTSWQQVIVLGDAGRGPDPDGWRAEFVRLAKTAAQMQGVPVSEEMLKQLRAIGYTGDDKAPRR